MDPTAEARSGRSHEGLHREVLESVRRIRAEQVRLSRVLLELRRVDSFLPFGVTTFALYCEEVGLSPQEGRDLVALAEAAEERPEVEERVGAARLSVAKAAAISAFLRAPALRRPGEDWLAEAERLSTRDMWRLLRERREELRIREAPVSLHILLSRRGRDAFGRSREIVARKTGAIVTEGATLEYVCDDFLDRHDPERRVRRADPRGGSEPPAPAADAGVPAVPGERGRRALPAALLRALVRRHGDVCWVDGCDRRSFLDNAHRIPHRDGGPASEDNLWRLCREHHRQFDGDAWRLHVRRDGTGVLIDRRGVVVGRLRGISPGEVPGDRAPDRDGDDGGEPALLAEPP